MRTPAAADGIAFWRRIERDRKAPWRLARALGPLLLLSYLLRVATLAQAMRLVSRRLGLKATAVVLPMILRARGKGKVLSQLAGDED